MGLVSSVVVAAMAMDSNAGGASRASIAAFQEAMMAITPMDSPYAEPVFARDFRPHLPRAPSGTEVGSIHIEFHAFFFVFLGVAACAIAGGWAPSPKCC